MKKNNLILMLALLSCIPTLAYDFEVDGIYYNITDATAKTVEVTHNNLWLNNGTYSGSVVIPESVSNDGIDYSVTSIGEFAFYGSSGTGLTSVSIPNSVTSIGGSAFHGCSALTSVTIPNSVTSIGEDAFKNCSGLIAISVEEGNIKYDSRGNCNALIETSTNTLILGCKNTIIPNNVTGIGNYAFMRSTLTSITIPNSVKSIGEGAFAACSDLTSLIGLNSVISIGGSAFFNCSSLVSVTIPSSVTSLGYGTFKGCTGLTSVTIGNGLTSIGDNAFSECSSLTSITIPNSVTSLGDGAFSGCTSLTSVTIGNGLTSIGYRAFYQCTALTSLTIPNSVSTIGESAFYQCTGLTLLTIPNSVTSIGKSAFNKCSSLTSVTIGNGLTSIGYRAFAYCTGLTSVKIDIATPLSISSISDVFFNSTNATLYVPYGSKAAYEAADVWNEFNDIVEFGNWLSTSTPTMLSGRGAMMDIDLTNDDDIIMTEFFLQLPEGICIAEDEDGYPVVTINADRENKHTVEVERTSDGLYHFLCFSTNNNAFKGHDGELLQVKLVSAEGIEAGTYTGTVKSVLMADVDRNEISQDNFTFDINVLDLEPGDVNADTKINGMDLVEMVDYIMERPSERFVFAAAELTDDGIVNGMDLVELIELIMAQNVQNAKSASMRAPAHQDAADLEPLFTRLSADAIALGVDASEDFILAQCVVELTGGAQLKDITTDNRHQVMWKQMGANKYMVLAYSTKNTAFQHNDALLTVTCKGEGGIRVSDVLLVDANRQGRWLGDKEEGCVTGIDGLMGDYDSDAEVYDLQGRKVGLVSSLKNKAKGVYMVNGKKVLVK